MSLTINDVRRISDLARIDLSEESAKKLMGELNDILSMVEQIQSVDTTGVAPMPHPFGWCGYSQKDTSCVKFGWTNWIRKRARREQLKD